MKTNLSLEIPVHADLNPADSRQRQEPLGNTNTQVMQGARRGAPGEDVLAGLELSDDFGEVVVPPLNLDDPSADESTMKSKPARIAAAWSAAFALLACIVSIASTPAAEAGGPGAQTSVIGGQEATPGSYPFMAFIVYFENEKAVLACTGTVIAPRVILTAAHCLFNPESKALLDPSGYRVVTGVVNWTDPRRQVSGVTRLIPYPKFVPGAVTKFGDAALLALATPTTAPPIPIATRPNARYLRLGAHARVAGWGMTNLSEPTEGAEQIEPTESLMWAKTVVEGSRCEGLWGRICAIDFPKVTSGVCHGDSGGPLFASNRKGGWVEIGITQAVFGNCTTQRPQLFTRTDLLSKWIKGRVQQIEAQP